MITLSCVASAGGGRWSRIPGTASVAPGEGGTPSFPALFLCRSDGPRVFDSRNAPMHHGVSYPSRRLRPHCTRRRLPHGKVVALGTAGTWRQPRHHCAAALFALWNTPGDSSAAASRESERVRGIRGIPGRASGPPWSTAISPSPDIRVWSTCGEDPLGGLFRGWGRRGC